MLTSVLKVLESLLDLADRLGCTPVLFKLPYEFQEFFDGLHPLGDAHLKFRSVPIDFHSYVQFSLVCSEGEILELVF